MAGITLEDNTEESYGAGINNCKETKLPHTNSSSSGAYRQQYKTAMSTDTLKNIYKIAQYS